MSNNVATVSDRHQVTYDAAFLGKLRRRDPATCTWFIYFFTPILEAKLRYELRDYGAVEDLRNETFYRVLTLVDRDRVRDPEHFGSFVRGVCAKVIQEHRRKSRSAEPLSDDFFEPADNRQPIDDLLVDDELRTLLHNELRNLPAEDSRLIAESYFQQRDRQEMARDRGISVVGLNVRLCRAMKRLRTQVFARI